MLTVVLLICSNTFMTIAWYGHLKFKNTPLLAAILASWSIALLEYCFQVPANRYGYADPAEQVAQAGVANAEPMPSGFSCWWHAKFSGPQLKILQEVITIAVFLIFNACYLRNTIRATDWAAFALIIVAVIVMMYPRWIAEQEEPKAAAPMAAADGVPIDSANEAGAT